MVPTEATLVALAKAMSTDAEPLLALREAAARIPQVRADFARRVRGPARPTAQPSFEERYLSYGVERYSQLAVVGLDLSRPERGVPHSVTVGGAVRNGRTSSHSWIGLPPAPGAADSSPASSSARS